MGPKLLLFWLTLVSFSAISVAKVRFFPNRTRSGGSIQDDFLFNQPFMQNLNSTSHARYLGDKTETTDTITQPITVRLKGDTDLGYYYVSLFFGTPPQKQTLIVDTGSVTTTVPCSECGNSCGKKHFDKPFDHNNSLTFETFQCDEKFGTYSCRDCDNECPFGVSYVEGSSYNGHFRKDFVVFGNDIEDNYEILIGQSNDGASNETSSPDDDEFSEGQPRLTKEVVQGIVEERRLFMPFGCTYRETKLFYDQEADGIIGLGVKTNTMSSPPNLLDALSLNNPKFSKTFSLCLSQDGGYFTAGGYNGAYHVPYTKIQYVPFSDENEQYTVHLHKIKMEGVELGVTPSVLNSGEGPFFDSGTTFTYFPSQTYQAFIDHLQGFCDKDSNNCAKGSKTAKPNCWKFKSKDFESLAEFYSSFPSFKFYFGKDGGTEYEWKPEDYFYLNTYREYCIGISRYDRETILGATFMKNHDILFDKINMRVGFVRANCGAVNKVTFPLYHPHEDTPPQPPISENTTNSTNVKNATNSTNAANSTNQTNITNRTSNSNLTLVETGGTSPSNPFDNTDNSSAKYIFAGLVIVAVFAIAGILGGLYFKFRSKNKYNDLGPDAEAAPSGKDAAHASDLDNSGNTGTQPSPGKDRRGPKLSGEPVIRIEV